MKALSMAIWIEVSLALGMRVKWRRWRVLSTRAMLKSVLPGQILIPGVGIWKVGMEGLPMPICLAFSSAPAAAIFAASRERQGSGRVAEVEAIVYAV